MSRTANSIKNIKYSIIGQFIGLLANFITRMVFVRVLNAEYLGINGLFTNILLILSFAELGIGPAIVYSLYKPLAENNIRLLQGLMNLYKRAYKTIGLVILFLGLILTPFLDLLIKDKPNINNIELIYILFVINTASTYFFSHKRSFLIADQKKYIDSFYHYLYLIIRNILQIFILLITKNFIMYLLIQLLTTFIENLSVSRKVDIMYPYIKNGETTSIDKSVKADIIKNIKAMLLHKIGSVVVSSTDNLLISKFIGIIEVGIYSNYLLIINALVQLFNTFFQSITASIGNLGVTETPKKNEFIFGCLDLIGLWIYGFSSIALFTLLNPFIKLWLGDEYIFSINIVIFIVINFYLTGRRRSVLTFRDALGLFWHDRCKPVLESIIKLTASIILINILGLEGAILGTIISTLAIDFWIEPYVLYKYAFKSSMLKYILRYIVETSIIIFLCFFNYWLNSFLGNTLVSFIGKILITAIVPNLILTLVFWKTKEFKYLIDIIKPMFKKHIIN